MLTIKQLKWMEAIGIRTVFKLAPSARIELQLPLAEAAPSAMGWNPNVIADKREQSRYFAYANFTRFLFHLPVLVFFAKVHTWWAFVLFSTFCVWHLLLVAMEIYKSGIYDLLPHDADAKEPPGVEFRPNPWGDGIFLPKRFESERFYERLGILPFQSFVLWYMHIARLTKQQRKEGRKIDFVTHVSYSELSRFEAGTRVGELVHIIFILFDLIPLTLVFVHKQHLWLPYMLFQVWGDTGLVLLQRYHRVRVWPMILKFREREERRKARAHHAKSSEPTRPTPEEVH